MGVEPAMKYALLVFAGTWLSVFTLGLQSLNVNQGHYLAAAVTSIGIGIGHVLLYRYMPGANKVEIGFYLARRRHRHHGLDVVPPPRQGLAVAAHRALACASCGRRARRRRPLRRERGCALMARKYETLGRRFLAILAEGGPRKPNVLRALARSEYHFRTTIRRLVKAGLVVYRKQHGGLYALAEQKAAQ
jgi:hypothetical protein